MDAEGLNGWGILETLGMIWHGGFGVDVSISIERASEAGGTGWVVVRCMHCMMMHDAEMGIMYMTRGLTVKLRIRFERRTFTCHFYIGQHRPLFTLHVALCLISSLATWVKPTTQDIVGSGTTEAPSQYALPAEHTHPLVPQTHVLSLLFVCRDRANDLSFGCGEGHGEIISPQFPSPWRALFRAGVALKPCYTDRTVEAKLIHPSASLSTCYAGAEAADSICSPLQDLVGFADVRWYDVLLFFHCKRGHTINSCGDREWGCLSLWGGGKSLKVKVSKRSMIWTFVRSCSNSWFLEDSWAWN